MLQTSVLNNSDKPIELKSGEVTGTMKKVVEADDALLKPVIKKYEYPDKVKINLELCVGDQQKVAAVISEYSDTFNNSEELNVANKVEHAIRTTGPPIASRPYRMSEAEKKVIQEEIKRMLSLGVIRHSKSPWSSPIVLARKKDGSVRFCVDYRKLNAVTERDVYPLPRIEDVLDKLQGKRFFSTCDAASGFWQIRLPEADKAKTAFTSERGLFEFEVMPFGLTNAPATFQRLMDQVFSDLLFLFILVYIDDIMVHS